MAEAYLNRFANERGLPVRAISAGTHPGCEVSAEAAAVMEEEGIFLNGQSPKALTEEMITEADRVISMGCGVDAGACPSNFLLTEDWQLDDPDGRQLDAVREIRSQIRARVLSLLAEYA